ncbi:hypothetical protein NPIL_702591 [Nephila pilipes]|uniref:PiggyBac transposable element-derived protein domain-containing protein n=1 Tax=Nephila pilipes TaxID=299642 RepID=A0A8X6NNH5_NEPPI|nr:hypothetical protein NPIL_702591 [Nephila pilipes]
MEKALQFLDTQNSDDSNISDFDVCIIPPNERGDITKNEDMNDEDLGEIFQRDIIGELEILRKDESYDAPSTSHSKIEAQEPSDIKIGFPDLQDLDPIQRFDKILSKKYIGTLACMTKLNTSQKGEMTAIDCTDIAQFLGLLLLSGYRWMPKELLHWVLC